MFHVFELPLHIEQPEPEPTYNLRVSFTYNESGEYEDISFQNLGIFEVIKDDVKLHDWRFVRNDGEVIGDGKDIDSLYLFYKFLDKNIKNFE